MAHELQVMTTYKAVMLRTVLQIDSTYSANIPNCHLRLFTLLPYLYKQDLDKISLFTLLNHLPLL